MSSQHKRPLFAFVTVAVACAVIMGYSWRAQALIEMIVRGDGPALVQAGERVLLGGVQASRGWGEESGSAAAERPAPADVLRPAAPQPWETARPRPRTKPGAKASRAWAKQQRVTPQQSTRPQTSSPQATPPRATPAQERPELEKPGREERPGVVPQRPRLPESLIPPGWDLDLPAHVLRRLSERLSRLADLGERGGHHETDPPGHARGHDESHRPGTARGHRKGYHRGNAHGHTRSHRHGHVHGHR